MNTIGSTSPKALDVMDFMEEGAIIMKFISDDAKIVFVNKKIRKILGYTEDELTGKGTEDLEKMILNEDVSAFADILYVPNNEPEPIRIVRMKNRTGKIIILALKSREIYTGSDSYVQILAQDVTDRISFFDGLPFSVVEFAIAQSRAHLMKIKKYIYKDEVSIETLADMINWTVTYVNHDALSSGIVDIGKVGQNQFIHHFKRNEILSITQTILNLLRGVEVGKMEYIITNNMKAKLTVDGMISLTKDSIIITSYSLIARAVFVEREDPQADRIDFLQKLIDAEKKKAK